MFSKVLESENNSLRSGDRVKDFILFDGEGAPVGEGYPSEEAAEAIPPSR